MGQRGPAKTPTAITAIRGNPGNRPINKREPKATVYRTPPKCPPGMDERTAKHWRSLAKTFTEMGVLQSADIPALKKLSFECACLEELQELVKKSGYLLKPDGRGKMVHISPAFKAMMELSATVDRALRQFGGTPASRTSIKTAEKEGGSDPWADM